MLPLIEQEAIKYNVINLKKNSPNFDPDLHDQLAEYARAAIRKIESYEKNGIYPGENLILTFETQQNVLDFKIIEEMIDRYLQ